MNKSKEISSGVRWTTISTIALAASSVLKLSILSRLLDPEDFGLMALVTFILGFMNLFMDMGLTSAILFFQDISKKQYASLFWLNFIFSFLLYFILIGLTYPVSFFYEEPELLILIPIMGLSLIVTALGRQFKTIEQKNLNFKFLGITDICSAILSLIVAVYLALEDYGVYSLVYSALVLYGVSSLIFFINGVRVHGLLLRFKFDETKRFLKIGAYQVGGQVVNYFNRDLDILIIGKLFTPEILGGYSLAKQLVFRPAQIINPILTRVATPVLAQFQLDKVVLKKQYLKLVNIVSSVNIPIYIGLIIFADFAVNLFYGDNYENIVILVQLLSVTMMFRAIGNPIGSLVVATGKTHLEFIWNIVVLFTVPIAVYLGALVSLEGIAWALIIARLVLFYPSWYFLVHKLIAVSFKEYVQTIVKLRIPKIK